MRFIAFAIASLSFTACTTVSVIPQQANVKTATVETAQSDLRLASNAYCEEAVERGWIAEGASWTEMARVLIDGRDAEQASPEAPNYADVLVMRAAHGVDPVAILVKDTQDAETGLAKLSDQVDDLLRENPDRKLQRADVTSYERALVHAQKSRRSFHEAAMVITADTTAPLPQSAEVAFASYDQEIDRARRTANRIADLYAERISRLGL